MTDQSKPISADTAAGSAIAIALIDKLIERGILTNQDVLEVLSKTQAGLLHTNTDAAAVVGAIYQRFSKNNG